MRLPIQLAALLACLACGKAEVEVQEARPADPAAEVTPAAQVLEPPQVLELERGLVVEVAQRGTGAVARRGGEVLVHYSARLSGAEQPFDSSGSRGLPDRWRLSTKGSPRLVEGLVLGLEGLPSGSKATLKIPAALAWGEAGNPAAGVPANADLVYEVTLLEAR